MFYQFETYNGKTIKYTLATYAVTYANEWVVPSSLMDWVRQQPDPIPYQSVVRRFSQMVQDGTSIFHVDFRGMVQILATIGGPISAETLKSQVPTALEIRDSVYGVSVRVSSAERSSTLLLFKENGYIISGEQPRFDEGDSIIWLVGSSTFYPVLDMHCVSRDTMQAYWKTRNQVAMQRPAQVGDAIQPKQREQQEQKKLVSDRQEPNTSQKKKITASTAIFSARQSTLFNNDSRWTADYKKIEHAGISREDLHEEVKKIKAEYAVGFEASTSLSVKLELSDQLTRANFYTHIALGANPNYQDYFKETNLHRVLQRVSRAPSKELYLNYVTWLMDAGANPDLSDEKGITARDIAKQLKLDVVCALFDEPLPRVETNNP